MKVDVSVVVLCGRPDEAAAFIEGDDSGYRFATGELLVVAEAAARMAVVMGLPTFRVDYVKGDDMSSVELPVGPESFHDMESALAALTLLEDGRP